MKTVLFSFWLMFNGGTGYIQKVKDVPFPKIISSVTTNYKFININTSTLYKHIACYCVVGEDYMCFMSGMKVKILKIANVSNLSFEKAKEMPTEKVKTLVTCIGME